MRHSPHTSTHLSAVLALVSCFLPIRLSTFPSQAAGSTETMLEPIPVQPGRPAGFSRLEADRTGIGFTNHLSEFNAAQNRILENGSGVALGDVDGDGWCDVYFCRLEGDNVLFRNLGDWRFQDITAASGVACAGDLSSGAVLVDVDGDGDLDLLVNSLGGGTREFLNDGKGRFSEVVDSRLVRRFAATSMSLADMDGDGDLDLYVTNYRTDTYKDRPPGLKVEARQNPDGSVTVEPRDRFITFGARQTGVEVLERGERDFLYLNQGDGRFVPLAWDKGTFLDEDGRPLQAPPTDWGLGVLFRDLNGDRWPDLYVCNDFVYWPDRLWLNEAGAGFRAAPRTALRSQSLASMAVDAADLNRDGWDDLFVADMLSRSLRPRAWQRQNLLEGLVRWPHEDPVFRPEVPRNTLQIARGDGTFAETAQFAGLAATDWTWSVVAMDVDLDGWEDLLFGTGNLHDVQDTDAIAETAMQKGPLTPDSRHRNWSRFPRLDRPKRAFRNRHDATFEERGREWGFNDVGIAHGMALADLDNDGDQDVVVNHLNASAGIYRNDSGAPRVAVRLRGADGNTAGIGSRITVSGGQVVQSQILVSGGRYCSGDEALRVFATGSARRVEVAVTWPSGRVTRVPDIPVNHRVLIHEDAGSPVVDPPPAESGSALFRETAIPLPPWPAEHRADAEFVRQRLLPRALGTRSPGVALGDLDADGNDDLVMAGLPGFLGLSFLGNGRGELAVSGWPAIPSGNRAVTAFLPTGGAPPSRFLVATEALDGTNTTATLQLWTPQPGTLEPVMDLPSVATALAGGDWDADGDLDLFVGGGSQPGRYPEGTTSRLFESKDGRWIPIQDLPGAGRIESALFTDLTGDGLPELVAATDWGPVRIWERTDGRFRETTERWGLADRAGWWRGIASGDLDGDGRLDLVVANWGRNFGEGRIPSPPAAVSIEGWGFSVPGTDRLGLVLGSTDPETGRLLPWRDHATLTAQLPAVRNRFPTAHAYAEASLPALAEGIIPPPRRWVATMFESMVFLNRGNRLEARPLPAVAQWSSSSGVSVADLDGDGHLDLVLTQNFFELDRESSRQDAGLGLVLKGNGDGTFRVLRPAEAGLHCWGEGRGCGVGDFNGDRRPDLIVAQRRGPLQMLLNQMGQPGYSVRLLGRKGATPAFGAVVRLCSGDTKGPALEVQSGSGWMSASSPRLLVGHPRRPTSASIRWPGGREQVVPWPQDTDALTLTQP
ncbi:MAG: FG-GAP-like repeat-containing protein [Verrucomicrobiota bacterium]